MTRSNPSLWRLVGATAAIAVVVGGSGGAGIVEYQIVHSSSFCETCHAERASHVRGHADVACQDCHAIPRDRHAPFAWAALVRSRRVPRHGEVREKSCATCHRADSQAWLVLNRTVGHQLHASATPPVPCVRCHAGSLHDRATPREGCLSCHSDVPLPSEPRAERDCVACHTFHPAPPDPSAVAVRQDPLTSRGGGPSADWRTRVTVDDVHGAADCARCHNPHIDSNAEHQQGFRCQRCHRGQLATEVESGPPQHRTCRGCHSVHAPRAQRAVACLDCHTMPAARELEVVATAPSAAAPREPAHRRRRGRGHDVPEAPPQVPAQLAASWTAVSASAAARLDPRTLPHRGHCENCHRPHRWTASPNVCTNCHAGQATLLAAMPAGSHVRCVDCHDPHTQRPDSSVCSRCHNVPRPGSPAAHGNCLSCHEPHSPRPRFATICSTCHGGVHRELSSGPAQHRDCGSCHDNHGRPAVHSRASCAHCHTRQAPMLEMASVPTSHRECAACHRPHSFQPAAARNACRGCHSEMAAASAIHHGNCLQCHQNHQAPLGRAGNCAGCHAQIRPTVPQHAQHCDGCHRPHLPAARALSHCPDCHASQVRSASGWPASSPHAGRCQQCHRPHDERTRPACTSCHGAQARPDHRGTHERCEGCHAPHQSPPAGGWWNRCGSCHREIASSAAAARGTHRQCVNCHRNVGQRPACTNCHSGVPGLLLHQHRGHGRCTDCHATHGPNTPTRATCLHCHEAQRATHYPDADRCQTCHLFRRE